MTLLTGDDWEIVLTLKRNGSAVDVDGSTIVAAVVTNIEGDPAEIIAETTQRSGATGADWSNGVVVVEFGSAATGAIASAGKYWLEIQVDDGKKRTWPRYQLDVKKGFIA